MSKRRRLLIGLEESPIYPNVAIGVGFIDKKLVNMFDLCDLSYQYNHVSHKVLSEWSRFPWFEDVPKGKEKREMKPRDMVLVYDVACFDSIKRFTAQWKDIEEYHDTLKMAHYWQYLFWSSGGKNQQICLALALGNRYVQSHIKKTPELMDRLQVGRELREDFSYPELYQGATLEMILFQLMEQPEHLTANTIWSKVYIVNSRLHALQA